MTLLKLKEYLTKTSASHLSQEYFQKYPLNRFWAAENMQLMKSIIEKSNSLQEIIHEADKSFLFSVNEASISNYFAVKWQVERMEINLKDIEIEESSFSFEGNNVYLDEKRLSPDFLRCLSISESIASFLDITEPVVLEIGGGTGHLARVIHSKMKSKNYVIVDIAETLAFSYAFLTLNYTEDSVHLYDPEFSDGLDLTKFQFILCPVQFFSSFPIKKFDLCINTASIGEMHRKTQNYWFDQVQNKLEVKNFYSLNRFLNSVKIPQHLWRLEENESNTGWNSTWEILLWELEPDFTRNPYVDTQVARYLEVFATTETSTNISPSFDEELFLKKITNQDWYRFKHIDQTMTYLQVQTIHDYTKSGTLFAIWDALRVTNYSNISALTMMIEYLNFLLKNSDFYFEEYFFYIEKLEILGCQELIRQLHRRNLFLTDKTPILIDQDKDNNLVLMNNIFYKIRKDLGEIRLEELESQQLDKFPQSYTLKSISEYE